MPKQLIALSALLLLCIFSSSIWATTMIGDTLTIRRAFPTVDSDYSAPVSTTVVEGTSDIVVSQSPFWHINPEANNIIIDVQGSSGMAGDASTFDGLVFSGFSNEITNVTVVQDVGSLVHAVTFDANFINVNMSGGFNSNDLINLQVDFASTEVTFASEEVVPEPSSWLLLGCGLVVFFRFKRVVPHS